LGALGGRDGSVDNESFDNDKEMFDSQSCDNESYDKTAVTETKKNTKGGLSETEMGPSNALTIYLLAVHIRRSRVSFRGGGKRSIVLQPIPKPVGTLFSKAGCRSVLVITTPQLVGTSDGGGSE